MDENNQSFTDWIKESTNIYIAPQKRKYSRSLDVEESIRKTKSWDVGLRGQKNKRTKMKKKPQNLKCTYFTDSPIYKGKLARGVKFNFKLSNFLFQNQQINTIVITIYGHSPLLLNVTGIERMEEVNIVRDLLEKLYYVKCLNVRIDNIFVSHKDDLNLDMSKMYYFLRDRYKIIDYNVEIFNALYIKRKGYPLISLFRTGSYQIMGGKTYEQIVDIKNFIKKLIAMFNKKNLQN